MVQVPNPCSMRAAHAPATVRGLAMVANAARHPPNDTVYVEQIAAIALRAPCTLSCQRLVTQIDPAWAWAPSFGVGAIKAACGVPRVPADG